MVAPKKPAPSEVNLKIIDITDSRIGKTELVKAIKSLDDRMDSPKLGNLWTQVFDWFDEAPGIYGISQTNGEIGGYNPGRARVVGNQIWCGNYANAIAQKLEERGIPYRMVSVQTDTSVTSSLRPKPFPINGKIERRYDSKRKEVVIAR